MRSHWDGTFLDADGRPLSLTVRQTEPMFVDVDLTTGRRRRWREFAAAVRGWRFLLMFPAFAMVGVLFLTEADPQWARAFVAALVVLSVGQFVALAHAVRTVIGRAERRARYRHTQAVLGAAVGAVLLGHQLFLLVASPQDAGGEFSELVVPVLLVGVAWDTQAAWRTRATWTRGRYSKT